VAELDLDQPLPDKVADVAEIEDNKSRYALTVTMARREGLTVRQLLNRLGGGRGHRTLAGTPEQVADSLEQWFTQGAADGFNIMPAVLPSGLDAFVSEVVPILQKRGLFREEYTGATLRDHYGLPQDSGLGSRSLRSAG
jgi:alkanesulfonate monooxygenase SsuD/methylene tetrahydromethanopterin reductase-like flavin-dependent oxidoreductase (luciferase family)